MENELVFMIDDIVIPATSFTETLIDAGRETQRPEVHVRFNDMTVVANENMRNLMQAKINNLALKRNDIIIWSSNNYSSILRLAFDVTDMGHEYTLVIV